MSVDPLLADAPVTLEEEPVALDEASLVEREAAAAAPDVAARLLVHAGRLREERGEDAAAEALYERVRASQPTYRPALDALRRLAARRMNWAGVERLYADELAFARDTTAKVELLRARAGVLRRLGRVDEANAVVEEALTVAPGQPALLEQSIAAARARGDVAKELELLMRAGRGMKDERLKARHLSRATRLAATLGNAALARELAAEWLAAAPTDLEAQAVALPAARVDVASAERIARAEVDASSGSTTRYRLARLLADRRQSLDDAHEQLLAAREINARDALALEALVDVAERRGNRDELVQLLTTRAETARDPRDKAVALLRLARFDEQAGRTEEAARRYGDVLALVPEHPEATAARSRIAGAATTSPEGERAKLEESLAAATEPKEKAELSARLAASLEDAGDTDGAIGRYLDALERNPDHAGARNALLRLYERLARWDDLAGFHEKAYLAAQEPAHKKAALVEMAEVLELRKNDVASAAAAYRMALDLDPDLATARALVRCATVTGKARDLVFGLEKEADGTTDRRRHIALLHRAADICREQKRAKDAVRLHERVLAIDPSYGPSRHALGTLYVEVGDTGKAAALRAPESTGSAASAEAHAALVAGDVPRSIAALRALVAESPQHPTAWAELARVAFVAGDAPTVADALTQHAILVADPLAKADVLYRLAEVADENLADPGRAEGAAAAAVQAAPRHAGAWKLLARLALARGDVARAVQALEQEVNVSQLKDRSTATRRLAAILAGPGNDAPRAVALLNQLLEEDTSDMAAVAELERLTADAGDRARSAELRGRFAARCADPRAAAALRLSAAEDRAALGDEDGAVAEYRRALALDVRARLATDDVIEALRRKGDRAALAEMYQRTAPYFDNESQAVLHLMRGELYEAEGNAPAAIRAYRDAFAADALLLPALRGARRLHEAAGEWNEARALLAEEGEAHLDPVEGVQLIIRAGEIAERVREAEQAEAHYLRALEKRPGEPQALARLNALLVPQGRFGELVTIIEREGEAVGATDPAGSARLYADAAWLRFDKLGEDRRAAVPLNRALARDPSCIRALELKAVLAQRDGRHDEAEEALSAALRTASGDAPAQLLLRLAHARLDAGRFDAALEAASEAATLGTSPELLELQLRAAVQVRRFDVALPAADALVESAQDRISGARYARLAAWAHQEAGEVLKASGLYRRALELLPGDREAIEGLESLHGSANDSAGLARAWQALADASAADAPTALGYLTRAASVWEKAGDAGAAATVYRGALARDATSVPLRLSLARSLARIPASRSEALNELRTTIQAAPLAPEPWRELVALFDADGRRDAAFVALGGLETTGGATPDERARRAELAQKLPALPQAVLGADDAELLVHPIERTSPVRELFNVLGPLMAKVTPVTIEQRGLTKDARIKGELKDALDRLAKSWGVAEVELYASVREPLVASVENTEPPAIVLGNSVAALGPRELRFLVGSLLARVRMRNHAAFYAVPLELATLVAEALRCADPSFARFGNRHEELGRRIAKSFSFLGSEKRAIEALLPKFAGAVNFSAFVQAMASTSHRFGLVACGDVAAAANALLRETGQAPVQREHRADLKELLSFAASEEHLALRQKLKIAVA